MAGELTQKELEAFYDLSTGFENYDAGDDAFNERLSGLTSQLNEIGGQHSMSYDRILGHLNDEWEHHGSDVNFLGKVYLIDDSHVELAENSWDGPYSDSNGTYYRLDGGTVVSKGVIDIFSDRAPQTQEDGTLFYPVQLAYAYDAHDLESDNPIFYARPEDILHATYEAPTYDAIATRLHFKLPRHMKFIDEQLDATGGDADKLVVALQKISDKLSEVCVAYPELELWLIQYIQNNAEYDRRSPYIVTLKGDFGIIDEDEDQCHYFNTSDEITRYMYLQAIGSRRVAASDHDTGRVDFLLKFSEPTSRFEEEGIASQVIVHPESIISIRSTRPLSSLSEISSDSIIDDSFRQKDADMIDNEAEVTSVPTEIFMTHPRVEEERRLAEFRTILETSIADIQNARRFRFRTKEDALDESRRVAKDIISELDSLNLTRSGMMSVSGGVYKGNADLTTGPNKFHLDIDDEMPVGSPEVSTDTMGFYVGMTASVDEMEDNDGAFWLIAPRLVLKLNEIHSTVLVKDNVEMIRITTSSTGLMNLDGTATFEIPHLDRIERRRSALARVAISERKTSILHDLQNIDQGLMHEQTHEMVASSRGLLRSIRKVAREINSSLYSREDALDALRQLLVERFVRIKAPGWLNGEKIDSKTHKGSVLDVFLLDTDEGPKTVISIDSIRDDYASVDSQTVHLQLDSLKELGF